MNDLDVLAQHIREGRTEEALAIVEKLKAFSPPQAGLNPVTVRGFLSRRSEDPINLTLGRLWLADKDFKPPDGKLSTLAKLWHKGNAAAHEGEKKNLEKCFTVVVWCGPDNHPQPLATGVFDEDKLLAALRLLFPKGELVDPAWYLYALSRLQPPAPVV